MKNKQMKSSLSFILVLVLLLGMLGGTFAYFSDYATAGAQGTAGTVALSMDSNINLLDAEGRDIINPGDKREGSFVITNEGNKSIDVRTTVALTALDRNGQPINFTGDGATQSEYDLYLASDVEYIEGEGHKPVAGAEPLQVKSINGNKITYIIPQYSLNGNSDKYDEVETIDGVTEYQHANDFVFVMKGTAGNEWQDSSVSIDVLVEAKQHENTGAGWDIVAQENIVHGSIDQSAVLAENAITENRRVNITVVSKDANGNDLNATASAINGVEKGQLLDSLEASGLAAADEVDALIEVESDDFDGMADTEFDVSDIAEEGDTVVILHFDEDAQTWEYIATETVVDGKVSGDFSSYSPVAFVVVPGAGSTTTPPESQPETQLLTVSIVNPDGTPFNSSYTSLTMMDNGFANRTTLTQVAPGSNQYVGTANPGPYRIIQLAPTISGGSLIEEFVIEEGQTEAVMTLKNTYEMVDVKLNIQDMSPDAAETTEYEFYLFNTNKLIVPKGELPVVRVLKEGGLHITEANHKVTPEYTADITDGMTMGIILQADTKVVFNITGAPADIYDIEYFADGVGSGYADFVDGAWHANGLAAGQYFVTVYGEGGSRYVGSFDYDGSASEVSFEVKQYAAQLNIVNGNGSAYRIRFMGEVDPFADTADSAVVNLMESGGFMVNEILLGETNYNYTLEYVSGDGSVEGNRVNVNSGLVIVNIIIGDPVA